MVDWVMVPLKWCVVTAESLAALVQVAAVVLTLASILVTAGVTTALAPAVAGKAVSLPVPLL